MAVYNVISALPAPNGDQRWMVQGYPTGRTSWTVETESTSDRDQAQRWADSLNAGVDPVGVQIGMYADD